MDAHAVQALVDAFNAAWSDHDLEAAIALVTDDCLFEATGPAPDGEPHRGRDAVRAAWAPIFADASAQFTTEEAFVAEDRLVQTWHYQWDGGHVRGIDVIRVRDGKISAKALLRQGVIAWGSRSLCGPPCTREQLITRHDRRARSAGD